MTGEFGAKWLHLWFQKQGSFCNCTYLLLNQAILNSGATRAMRYVTASGPLIGQLRNQTVTWCIRM